MSTIFLSLGGNIGDVRKQLEMARAYISQRIGEIEKESKIYKTEAWGNREQPSFYNQCIKVETAQSPSDVLNACQQIEQDLGRVRKEKWGPRPIDIDILYYDEDIIDEEKLRIPHPYLQDRNFVLVPLQDIAPDFVHPLIKLSTSELRKISKDKLEVTAI